MLPQKNWSPELDGLRGYASLWVFLGHICILTQFNIPLLSNPDLGVDLFILLSGYLMAKNYIERRLAEPWESKMTIIRFWMRRFFRIAPLYYFLLLIAFYFGEHFGYYRDVIASAWPVTQQKLPAIRTHPLVILSLIFPLHLVSCLITLLELYCRIGVLG